LHVRVIDEKFQHFITTLIPENSTKFIVKRDLRSTRQTAAIVIQLRLHYTLRDLKVGLGISRTNADSQWNPVYNVFHRFFCCANETIRR